MTSSPPLLPPLCLFILLLSACSDRPLTHLPATSEVGWVEFITPSRARPACSIIAHQSALAAVALDAKPGDPGDDAELLAQLTDEADRPLIPMDPQQVAAPSRGCSSPGSIHIRLRSDHVVVITARGLTCDGKAIEPFAHRWFLADDGTLKPILP